MAIEAPPARLRLDERARSIDLLRAVDPDVLQNQILQAGFDLASNVAFANRLALVGI